jgi:hypothetical protein
MAIASAHITCDICKRPKELTNHWQVAITKPGLEGVLFLPAEAVESPRHADFVYEDICGQECCHKRLSRWLDDLNAPSTVSNESEAA